MSESNQNSHFSLSTNASNLLWSAFTLETRKLTYDESYYEYVPDRLQWNDAGELCNQRSGALATVSNPVEKQELTSFLTSLNITLPVWIARNVMTRLTSRFSVLFEKRYIHMMSFFLNSMLIVSKTPFHLLTGLTKGL